MDVECRITTIELTQKYSSSIECGRRLNCHAAKILLPTIFQINNFISDTEIVVSSDKPQTRVSKASEIK